MLDFMHHLGNQIVGLIFFNPFLPSQEAACCGNYWTRMEDVRKQNAFDGCMDYFDGNGGKGEHAFLLPILDTLKLSPCLGGPLYGCGLLVSV